MYNSIDALNLVLYVNDNMQVGKTKPSVGILTPFQEWKDEYSLKTVVESQLISLVKHGYKPVLYVLDSFVGEVPEGVELKKIVPTIQLPDYSDHHDVGEDFWEKVDTIYQALKEHLDVDIVIEHDMIFQGWFLPHCVAIHKLAEESDIKWFHWIHSFPNVVRDVPHPHSLRYTLPKNSKLVYLNNHDVVRAAEAYQAMPKDVRVVHNALDPRQSYSFHPLVSSLIEKYDLLSADVVQTYPFSSTRMGAKGVNTIIEIFGAMKRNGKSVRLLLCNAHANAKNEKDAIARTSSFAAQHGLNASEVIFTSLEDVNYESGVPRDVVSQLFLLSNVFIFPSTSENCSLILLEAMLAGNVLVLNDDVPSMREFGKGNALYFGFSSIHTDRNYADRESYMNEVALHIISELSINRPLKAQRDVLKNFNYDKIFKEQIEPLFYEA